MTPSYAAGGEDVLVYQLVRKAEYCRFADFRIFGGEGAARMFDGAAISSNKIFR